MIKHETYEQYSSWFDEMIRDKNIEQIRDSGLYEPLYIGGPPEKLQLGVWSYKTADMDKLIVAIFKKKWNNASKYSALSKYINGDPFQGTFNDEYLNVGRLNLSLNKKIQNDINIFKYMVGDFEDKIYIEPNLSKGSSWYHSYYKELVAEGRGI